MEANLDHKLEQCNPVLTAQTVSKLVEAVKIRRHSIKRADDPEVKFLVKTCACNKDSSACLTASMGLISLVECGAVDPAAVLNNLMSSLAGAR